MFFAVLLALVLLGATTWLAMNQGIARNPTANRQLTGLGLLCCLAAITGAIITAVIAW